MNNSKRKKLYRINAAARSVVPEVEHNVQLNTEKTNKIQPVVVVEEVKPQEVVVEPFEVVAEEVPAIVEEVVEKPVIEKKKAKVKKVVEEDTQVDV